MSVHVCEGAGGGGCIVRHITAPDVQFALQPRLNGGTVRNRENEDVGVMASKQKKEMGTKSASRSELFFTLHFSSVEINSEIFLCLCCESFTDAFPEAAPES